MWGKLIPILAVPRGAEQTDYAGELVEEGGDVCVMLDQLEEGVVGPWLVGGRQTMTDIYIYAALCWWGSGFFTPKYGPLQLS